MTGNPAAALNQYELRHLPAHLVASGRLDDLHRLLRLASVSESSPKSVENAWFAAKDAANQLASFADDVELAWRSEIERDAGDVPTELRCLLMRSSARTMTRQVPDALILALVERGVWSAEQGFAEAQDHPAGTPGDRWKRALLLAGVLRSFAAEARPARAHAVIEEARELEDRTAAAEVLWELVAALPEAERPAVAAEAMQTTRRAGIRAFAGVLARAPAGFRRELWRELTGGFGGLPPELQEQALSAVGPHLSLAEVEEAVGLTRQMRRIGSQGPAVAALAARLPPERRLELAEQEFNDVVRGRGVRNQWADRLIALCPVLPRAWIDAVMSAVEPRQIAFAVLAAALDLSPSRRRNLVRKGVNASRRHQNELWHAQFLATIARACPESERPAIWEEALTAALAVDFDDLLVMALRGMVPHLEPIAFDAFLEVTRQVKWSVERAELFRLAAAAMPADERPTVYREALGIVESAESDFDMAYVIAALAPELPEELLDEGLDCVDRIEGAPWRAHAVTALAPYLDASRLRRALAQMRAIVDAAEATRAILSAVAFDQESASVMQDCARSVAAAVRAPTARASALTRLGRALTAPERVQVLRDAHTAARSIADPYDQADALTKLARAIDVDQRESILSEALDAIRRHDIGGNLDERLRSLAALLPRWLLDEALEYTRSLPGSYRPHAMAALVPFLPIELAVAVCDDALAAATSFDNPGDTYQLVVKLAPHLPSACSERAVSLTLNIDDTTWRPQALSAIAQHISDEERRKLLTNAERWLSDDELARLRRFVRADELRTKVDQASTLTADQREALLDEILDEDGPRHGELLPALIPLLTPQQQERAAKRALEAARNLQYGRERAGALAELAAVAPESVASPAREEALRAARRTEPVGRCDALLRVADALRPSDRRRALAEAADCLVSGQNEIGAGGQLVESIRKLAVRVAALPAGERTPIALRAVRQLERFERPDALRALAAFAPALLTQGCGGAVASAITDVESWWP